MAGPSQSPALVDQLSAEFKREYAPQSVLGEGAMGLVILAVQLGLERQVAVKFLTCFTDAGLVGRFEREGHLSSQLDHPSIVKLFATGVDREIPYLVYEYVPGDTLRGRVAKVTRIAPVPAIALAKQLLDGLAHAHAKTIVHRDLKPANLLVTADDVLKIADYGIGSSMEIQTALTRTGTLLGTPMYMSPEQWAATPGLASDVYAAGLIVHEMLTGENPFYRQTLTGIRNAHLYETRPKLPPGMDPRLDELLDAMMGKVPDTRPTAARAKEWLEEIERTYSADGAPARAEEPPAPPPPVSTGPRSRARTTGPASRAARTGGAASRPGLSTTAGVGSTADAHATGSTAPGGRAVRAGLALAAGAALALAGLALRTSPPEVKELSAVAGTRSAGLTIACDRAVTGAVSARVEPAPPALSVKATERDASRRAIALALEGLSPGTSYRVQPLLDGAPWGPPHAVSTHGSPEQLVSGAAVSFTGTRAARVTFSTPLTVPAGLSLGGEVPADWVSGAPGQPRALAATGLDPDGTTKPAVAFEGLPELVTLPELPGARRLVERARARLASAVGGPPHKDRQALFARILGRSKGLTVPRERVKDEIDRHVLEATGAKTELVLSAAAAVAGDAELPVDARWRALEVLDGLEMLEAIGRPWCGAHVLDVAARRPAFPLVTRLRELARPADAPEFPLWVRKGRPRELVEQHLLPLWSHRDEPEGSEFMRMQTNVGQSYSIEERLSESPFWARLTPPSPLGGAGASTLALRPYRLCEDRVLWVRFGKKHALALFGPRGAKPDADSSKAGREAKAPAITIALPPGVGGHELEVRHDSFEAVRGPLQVPAEMWIVDAWVMP